jgi:hypothetical protein
MIRKINNVFARIESPCDEQASQSPQGALIYLDGVLIKADRIKVGDTIWIRSVILKSGTSLTCTGRLYWNTSINTSGATQLAVFTISSSTRHFGFLRRIHFPSQNSGVIMRVTTDLSTDMGDQATNTTSIAIPGWLSTTGYFFITIDATGRTPETLKTLYISVEI